MFSIPFGLYCTQTLKLMLRTKEDAPKPNQADTPARIGNPQQVTMPRKTKNEEKNPTISETTLLFRLILTI